MTPESAKENSNVRFTANMPRKNSGCVEEGVSGKG